MRDTLTDLLMAAMFLLLTIGQFVVGQHFFGTPLIVIYFILQLGVIMWILSDESE